MESNHHSARHRVYSAGSSPMLSVREDGLGVAGRARTGADGDHSPGCFLYTTATMKRGRPDSNRRPLA